MTIIAQIEPVADVTPAIVSAGRLHVVVGSRPRVNRLQNAHWAADCLISGQMDTRTGSARSRFKPRRIHDIHIYPPKQPYWERLSDQPQDSFDSIYIVFRGGDEIGLRRMLGPASGSLRVEDPEAVIQAELETALEAGILNTPAGFWQAQAALMRLIAIVVAAEEKAPGVRTLQSTRRSRLTASEATVQAAQQLMRANLDGSLTLEDLAAACHVSVSTLCRRYRRVSDATPMADYMALRLNAARSLLLRGETIKSVAYSTGFTDAFHFSRSFRKAYGLPPSAVRESG